MSPVIRAVLWRFVAVMVLGLSVGGLIGYPLDFLLCVLIAYILWGILQLSILLRWVMRYMRGRPVFLWGAWRELANLLRRQRQRQRVSTSKLRQTVKRIYQLTHAVDEGLIVLEKDLRLQWWNAAASKLLNLQVGDKRQPIVNHLRDPAFIRYLRQTELTGSIELPAPTQPGRWLLFTASRFGQGEIVLVVMDITRLKNLELTRKEFVGNVSHELRTPLTVLRGYLETLTSGMVADNPPVQRACEQMTEQVMRMQGLADDLIMLSRLEAQADKVELQVVRLQPVLEKITEEARVLGNDSHSFTLDCEDHLAVMALPGDLRSAIGNLIVNAVRHNPEGADIILSAAVSGEGRVVVSVKDNGVGISADAIPRLTERFYRTDSSRSSKIAGTGLGLAIVKHALSRMGGKLEIKSRLGYGSEFICTFKMAEVSEDGAQV